MTIIICILALVAIVCILALVAIVIYIGINQRRKRKVAEEARRKAEEEARRKAENKNGSDEEKPGSDEVKPVIDEEKPGGDGEEPGGEEPGGGGETVEKADYVVPLDSVVSYFKTLGLKKGEDIPFMSYIDNDNVFIKEIQGAKWPQAESGKRIILLGVYNEKDNTIKNYKLIEAPDFDPTITTMLQKDGYAVLK